MNVVAGLAEGDLLDPIHRVDRSGSRVAVGHQPAIDPVRSGVVGGQGQDIGAVKTLQHALQVGAAKADVVVGVAGQPVGTIDLTGFAGHQARGRGHQLHKPAGAGPADGLAVEGAFLADKG